jgi:hypothetical protein
MDHRSITHTTSDITTHTNYHQTNATMQFTTAFTVISMVLLAHTVTAERRKIFNEYSADPSAATSDSEGLKEDVRIIFSNF